MTNQARYQLHQQLTTVPAAVKLIGQNLDKQFKRYVYRDLRQHLQNFLQLRKGYRWVIMPGLRGVGKTTLLAQLYYDPLLRNQRKFYLSLDFVQRINANMMDVEAVIEQMLGCKIEEYDQPIFLFLDEVHFSPDWSLALKILIDNSSNLYAVCTGSSALSLQTNTDIVRRADIIKVNPLSFTEFIAIRQMSKQPDASTLPLLDTTLSLTIKEALFESVNVEQAYERLESMQPAIQGYWSQISQQSTAINEYLQYGTLPFTLNLKDYQSPPTAKSPKVTQASFEYFVYERIAQTLDTIVVKDILPLNRFSGHVLDAFPKLIAALTYADAKSLNRLSKELQLSVGTIQNMLSTLCQNEIIMEVRPRGFSFGHVRKNHKYLFTSPAIRATSAHDLGQSFDHNSTDYHQFRGRLLEDLVGSYLKRLFIDRPLSSALEYDASKQGADFILSRKGIKENAIIIEVGMNKSTAKQAIKTLQKGGRYGLVFNDDMHAQSATNIMKVDTDNQVLHVTSAVFLLL